jgi:hypothetical protein
MSYCRRCAAGQLPGAAICRVCCTPLDLTDEALEEAAAADGVAGVTEPSAADAKQAETVFASWPFGGADAEAAAQVAAQAAADSFAKDVRAQLAHYAKAPTVTYVDAAEPLYPDVHHTTYTSAQSSTHILSAVPGQREGAPAEEIPSVPSTGPNPFLAAARMQQARDEAAAEGYAY